VIEQRILRHATFEQIAVNGTPDIRVIAYRGVPAMAMIRLPTYASRGRANLHQGAVGAGIELHTGRTMGGVWKSRMIDLHPDTRQPIGGMEVPHWNEVLRMSVRLARQLELGYVGVDFVLDQARGPLVLEANARPGLAIQLANRQGLLQRLDTIDACLEEFDSQATRTDSPDVELGLLARLAEA
jgi:alpha-L-glutamate ligase-like protein